MIQPAAVAVPADGRQKDVGRDGVVEDVAIPPVAGREAGVPAAGNLRGGTDPDRARQAAVQGGGPAVGGNRTGGLEMCDLGGGMDAAVGSAGSDDAPRAEGVEVEECLLQGLLNAPLSLLPLPAAVGGSVVLKTQSDAPDGGQTSSMIAISALSPRRGTVRMMRV
jgi:hypothetical protein